MELALNEYSGLYDFFGDDGGEMNMSYAYPEHNGVMLNFATMVKGQLRGTRCVVLIEQPFHWDEDERCENRFPDVAILCDDKRRKGVSYIGVPRFVMEVLSDKTEAMDRGEKMSLYARVGIEEYWLADWRRRKIERYLLDDMGKAYIRHDEINDDNKNEPVCRHLLSLVMVKVDFDEIMEISDYQV